MTEHSGQSGEALESARAVLAARDRDLAAADAELSAVIAGAHSAAADAIRRIEAMTAEIESAVVQHAADTPAQGREFARFLLDKQRELVDLVAAAKSDAAAKTAALQGLLHRYQG
ncbi:DUF4226 domain-containing protein [Mycobacterium sp. NBC_00419]|uniref:DUF4226 domain-containing protein n=1 Tax=Mycobacterium sp. NBC_00419 TaxID=2975989 RepID=UPI002E1BDD9A